MKKFNIAVSAALLMSMAAGISGCNATPAQTSLPSVSTESVTSETVTETSVTEEITESETEKETSATEETTETTSETTTEATTTTTEVTTEKLAETAAASAKTTVTDQYKRGFKVDGKTLYTHIPKVTIEGVSTKAFNDEILKKFQDIGKKNESRLYYSYYIGKKTVSLYITVELESGNSEFKNFYAYNCSRTTGKKLSRSEMLKIMGVSSSTLNSKVKIGVNKLWKEYEKDTSAKKKAMQKKSLTTAKFNEAVPYYNKDGKKAYVLRQIEVPGQLSHVDIHATF